MTVKLEGNHTDYEYGVFNDTKADREYFTKVYKNRGRRNIKVKRVQSDTKGLKMYEITYNVG